MSDTLARKLDLAKRAVLDASHPTVVRLWTEVGELAADEGGGWLVYVPTDELVAMRPDYNPKGRTDPHSYRAELRPLGESLVGRGLLMVPLINDTTVIDGNRRIAGLALQGRRRVLCLYAPWATPEYFAQLTHHQKEHTPMERAETYLKCPAAVHPKKAKGIQTALETMGEDLFRYCLSEKKNPVTLLNEAKGFVRWCLGNSEMTARGNEFLLKVCRCLLELEQQAAYRRAKKGKGDVGPVDAYQRVLDGIPLEDS